jgi:penicillin-binding protein 1C
VVRRKFFFSFPKKKVQITQILLVLVGWTVLLSIYLSLPKPLFKVPYAAVLTDKNGQLLSARIAKDGQWRFPSSSQAVEKYTVALVEYEDKRFYYHRGVDFIALASAFKYNAGHPRRKRGGSTLSMQVIRMSLNNPPRTYWQKIKELVLASVLEITYSKKEILNWYAAHAPFGGNVVGIDAAAWRYFGKNISQITWSEACLLAVLPNSPGLIHPGRNRDKLKIKRDKLLDNLYKKKVLDHEKWQLAREEPLPEEVFPLPQLANHLLSRTFPHQNGGIVHTTLDVDIQERLQERLQQYQHQLSANGIENAAILVLEVSSGKVIAYLGNSPVEASSHGRQVDLIMANRSSGSILKPFLYALSLQEGLILPTSWLSDVPLSYRGYRPANFDQSYSGMVAADQALIKSLNIPFVQLLKKYNVGRFHNQLKKMGIHSLPFSADHYGLSLILGGAEVNLWDLCGIYSSMARSLLFYTPGNETEKYYNWHSPWYVNTKDKAMALTDRQVQVIQPGAIYSTWQAMIALKRPDEDGNWQQFSGNQPIAWKTGTSFGFRDAWAIGTSTSYCVGVWVGNASGEGKPGLTGIKVAAPLLFSLFNELPEKGKLFPVPSAHLHLVAICKSSGWLAGPFCPQESILAPKTIKTGEVCPFHKKIFLTNDRQYLIHLNCLENEAGKAENRLVLPPLEAFYFRKNNPDYNPLPNWHPLCLQSNIAFDDNETMEWIYPREFTQIKIPKNLDGTVSKTVFQLAHRSPEKTVYWHIDGVFVGKTRIYHQMIMNPGIGRHLMMAMDEDGNRIETTFEIMSYTKR